MSRKVLTSKKYLYNCFYPFLNLPDKQKKELLN